MSSAHVPTAFYSFLTHCERFFLSLNALQPHTHAVLLWLVVWSQSVFCDHTTRAQAPSDQRLWCTTKQPADSFFITHYVSCVRLLLLHAKNGPAPPSFFWRNVELNILNIHTVNLERLLLKPCHHTLWEPLPKTYIYCIDTHFGSGANNQQVSAEIVLKRSGFLLEPFYDIKRNPKMIAGVSLCSGSEAKWQFCDKTPQLFSCNISVREGSETTGSTESQGKPPFWCTTSKSFLYIYIYMAIMDNLWDKNSTRRDRSENSQSK